MAYKRIRFTGFLALMLSAVCILGMAALTLGLFANPAPDAANTMLLAGFLAFSMLGTVATDAATILESQADQIAELRRQLGSQGSAA